MKKLLLLLAAVGMIFTACEKVDLSDIYDRLDTVENQLGISHDFNNKIYYTTSDGKKLFPKTDVSLYGAILISNTYKDGQGVLVFDDVVTSIGDDAFDDCTSLTSVTIPNSVTSIGGYAFRNCTSLTSATIGNSVTSIGYEAFSGCESLTRVDISDLSAWCKISFNYNANPLCYGAKLYLNGSELTDMTIPSDITEIKEYAFIGCISLKSVTIPDSVTKIGSAFYNCTSLTSVTIPDSVTSIGYRAFYQCSSLKEVYCKSLTPPTAVADYGVWRTFDNNASGRKIYVPRNSVSAYKAAQYWSDYASYIVGYDF